MGKGRHWIHILYENLVDSLIWEETFEITINRCVWFLYSLPALRVDRKRLYMYKKGAFGGWEFRPHLLKINTAVDEDIECQSWYQIRKGSIKGLKNEKAKWHRQIYLTGLFILRISIGLGSINDEFIHIHSFILWCITLTKRTFNRLWLSQEMRQVKHA